MAGLGGCPYSPGATGNVATEDVLYALQSSQYHVNGSTQGGGTVDLMKMVDIGWWISERLGRETVSRAGRAIRSRQQREVLESNDRLVVLKTFVATWFYISEIAFHYHSSHS